MISFRRRSGRSLKAEIRRRQKMFLMKRTSLLSEREKLKKGHE